MHDAFAVLVVAERFDWERQQVGFLFGKHGSDLAFGGAMNAGIGPALFPAIQVGLSFFQALESQTFQRRSLCVADAGLDFSFSIGILDAARHGHRAVVREDVTVKRIESGIVNVRDEHALA